MGVLERMERHKAVENESRGQLLLLLLPCLPPQNPLP